MRRFRNPSMRPNRRIGRARVRCHGGPLDGIELILDNCGGKSTLPFVLRGESGRYIKGEWEAA